jgi:hypothetical protein
VRDAVTFGSYPTFCSILFDCCCTYNGFRSAAAGVRSFIRYTRRKGDVDERFQAILDNLPPKPPRSRLEPYWELIRELRRRGRTYRDIAQLLAEKFEVAVSPSTVHDFVRVRTRPRQRSQQVELPAVEMPASETATVPDGANEATADVKERIEAIRRRPPPETTSKRRFEYDESAPLKLIPKSDQEIE